MSLAVPPSMQHSEHVGLKQRPVSKEPLNVLSQNFWLFLRCEVTSIERCVVLLYVEKRFYPAPRRLVDLFGEDCHTSWHL